MKTDEGVTVMNSEQRVAVPITDPLGLDAEAAVHLCETVDHHYFFKSPFLYKCETIMASPLF